MNAATDGKQIPHPGTKLSLVRTGKQKDNPRRILLYGPEGVGKSSFAAGSKTPIFVGKEDGLAEIDCPKWPEPKAWLDVFEAIRELREQSHEYQTVVFDTIDWIEPLVHAHVCARDDKANLEAYGFGKGYKVALEEWRKFINELDTLRASRKLDVILLGHSAVKSFKNPEGEDYDRYGIKINEQAAGLFREWCDVVLFANWDTPVEKKEQSPAKAYGGTARMLHTERRAAFDAKNRYNLPPKIPLSWDDFAFALTDGSERAEKLREEINALLGDVTETRVKTAVSEILKTSRNDIAQLSNVLNRLKAKVRKTGADA